MGTHASAEIFYGVAWPAEELPEKWAAEQQARWDAGNYDGDEDEEIDRMGDLLKELKLDGVLETGGHGNLAYDYSGDQVYVRNTRIRVGCGDAIALPLNPTVSDEGAEAIRTLVEHLGADKAEVGWLVTVTYG